MGIQYAGYLFTVPLNIFLNHQTFLHYHRSFQAPQRHSTNRCVHQINQLVIIRISKREDQTQCIVNNNDKRCVEVGKHARLGHLYHAGLRRLIPANRSHQDIFFRGRLRGQRWKSDSSVSRSRLIPCTPHGTSYFQPDMQ